MSTKIDVLNALTDLYQTGEATTKKCVAEVSGVSESNVPNAFNALEKAGFIQKLAKGVYKPVKTVDGHNLVWGERLYTIEEVENPTPLKARKRRAERVDTRHDMVRRFIDANACPTLIQVGTKVEASTILRLASENSAYLQRHRKGFEELGIEIPLEKPEIELSKPVEQEESTETGAKAKTPKKTRGVKARKSAKKAAA